MLKKTLINSGLFIGGLLVIMLTVNAEELQQPVISTTPFFTDTLNQFASFDSSALRVIGLSEEDEAAAPAIPLNKNISKYVPAYVENNGELLRKIKENNPGNFKIMDSVFTWLGLPVELKYLAIIESELNTKAVSRVGAVGAWQLMPETARLLKLKVTSKNDERKHFYKSTVAAAKYLSYLHTMLGDWLLAIAAYNSGPGTVLKAIKKSGSKNYWKLQYLLPPETRGHVKRFISTHYFYEGQGGVTTLTKAEIITHTKKLMAFVDTYNTQQKEDVVQTVTVINSETVKNTEIPVSQKTGELKLTDNNLKKY